ncbi:lipid-A-disaccharide synthase [Mesonia sp. HuA40]|uniref:lipid-A-disaccharide synthase n=1 Tax=Mesonia sp. HuA40 TaxID=2602761 RepID=UPI0011CC2FCC|nr:lipid-A-disaccharide synthase [Mesonia sp. HuA40]TXK71594.1 lipid-A-disaccharide synthase [Mesonia sp. HuA40]
MKYYLIAGEASGDLHAANLMKALLKQDAKAEFRFWGGDLMQAVGGKLVKHYRDLAFMGFIEVVANLNTIFKNIKICKADISTFQPDVIIFVDYPGFNFRIAKWAKKQGFKTHYYISPQIWAWKENRIKAIKRDIDAMYVILPFEKDFYEQKHKFPVHFVGHPLLDAIDQRPSISHQAFIAEHNLNDLPIIALLPGSRQQEISKMLKTMLEMVPHFPNYQFVIAGAPSQDLAYYEPFLAKNRVSVINNKTYDLLEVSTAALVTSGTATLETALFNIPEVVCYKGSYISYQIAKRIIKLNYISLVNLIMDKPVVTELIQNDFNPRKLREELNLILQSAKRKQILEDYQQLREKLGGKGASERTAKLIYNSIKA